MSARAALSPRSSPSLLVALFLPLGFLLSFPAFAQLRSKRLSLVLWRLSPYAVPKHKQSFWNTKFSEWLSRPSRYRNVIFQNRKKSSVNSRGLVRKSLVEISCTGEGGFLEIFRTSSRRARLSGRCGRRWCMEGRGERFRARINMLDGSARARTRYQHF